MATFGYSTTPVLDTTIPSQQHIDNESSRHYAASGDQEINYIKAYVKKTAGDCTVDLAVYDMGTGSDPEGATLVGSAQTITITETSSLTLQSTTELSDALTNGNNYTVSCGNKTEAAGTSKIGFASIGGSQMKRNSGTGALLSTFTADLGNTSYVLSVFAETGAQPGPPVWSTIPDYSEARTTTFLIESASYCTNTSGATFSGTNLPSGSSIDTSTGDITWATPTNGTYSNVSVTCTNGQGAATSADFTITINAQAPTLTASPIGNQTGNVGLAITPLDTSTAFNFGVTYAISSGTLPSGLSIASGTGIVTGTPDTQSNYTLIEVTATNPDGSIAAATFDWDISGSLTIPSITTVNSGNGMQRTESITITGTDFEASQGSGTVTYNGNSLTVTAWADTSITVTAPSEGYTFGVNYDLVITNNSGNSDTASIQFVPKSGYSYVTLNSNYAQLPTNAIVADEALLSGLVIGDQIEYETTASPEGTSVVDNQGIITISSATSGGDYTLDYLINDVSDLTVSGNGASTLTIETNLSADTTAPTWSSAPAISNITETTADLTSTISETGSIWMVVVLASSTTPSIAQVKAGTDASDAAATFADSVSANTSLSSSITGLTEYTQYKACLIAEDDESTPNVQASVFTVTFTTTAEADTTAPTFTIGPSVSDVQIQTIQVDAEINETGTIYFGVIEQAETSPSPTQLKAGSWTGGEGTIIAPLAYDSASVFSNYTASSLKANTAYKAIFAPEDSSGNMPSTVTEVNFTTLPTGSIQSVFIKITNAVTKAAIANKQIDWQIQTTWGVVTDTGTDTTDANGEIILTYLNAAPGAARFLAKDTATGEDVANAPVTILSST